MSKKTSTKASTKTQVATATPQAAPAVHTGMTREMIEERKAILRDLMIKNPAMGCKNLAAALGVSRSSIRRIYALIAVGAGLLAGGCSLHYLSAALTQINQI